LWRSPAQLVTNNTTSREPDGWVTDSIQLAKYFVSTLTKLKGFSGTWLSHPTGMDPKKWITKTNYVSSGNQTS